MKKLIAILIVFTSLSMNSFAQQEWITQIPKDCFCCNEKIYNLPTPPPINGPSKISCDSSAKFQTMACPGATITWTVTPSNAFTGAGTNTIILTSPIAAGNYTITVTIKCGNKTVTNQKTLTVTSVPNCSPKFDVVLTELANGNYQISASPATTLGVLHYWGLVDNQDGSTCTHIPLLDIPNGQTFGAKVTPAGVFTHIGMGNPIAVPSPSGYQYSGLSNNGCFKITHYVICCGKWYRQTQCFCIRQARMPTSNNGNNNLKRSIPNSTARVELLKPHDITFVESAVELVPENEVPKQIKEK